MKPKIEVISASAGSGKTTRIAKELRDRVQSGRVRPEAVLATTFTRHAADELKQRVRGELFAQGLTDEAMQLEGARIGTVNAVCGRLVADFAFELGLSPELRVIDEDQAAVTLNRVISRVVTQEEREVLAELSARFWELDWQADIKRLLVLCRSNLLDGPGAGPRLSQFLAPAQGTAEARDAELLVACEAALLRVHPEDDTKITAKSAATTRDLLAALRRGPATWSQWGKALAGDFKAARGSKGAFDDVAALAKKVCSHPRLHADLQTLVDTLFALTSRVLAAYAAEKKELGVLDFVDQETLAHELLRNPVFAERLSEQLDLVLVDEFQDTSPLQLSIFTRLAELAKESVWVGDQKQAIFGFRGTDPALMDAAIEAVLGTDAPEVLPHSWRSRPGLVALTSELFARAFSEHGLPEERVRLTTVNHVDDARLGAFLERWTIPGKRAAARHEALADGVSRLLADPSVQVRAREGGTRSLRRGDVAVLCRRNFECQSVATELARLGIAATVNQPGLLSTPEARAAVLGLQLFIDPRDRLAAAELALLLEHPDDPDGWLNAVVTRGEHELPFAHAAFHAAIEDARTRAPHAGALLALTLAIDALSLPAILPRWGRSEVRLANLDALRAHACDYVGKAEADGSAATAAGLVTYLHELERQALDRQALLPGADAVVVSTWHAAKGLEWPVTVLFFDGQETKPNRFGPEVRARQQGFSMARPLEGRFVRYWPNPFHPSQRTPLLDAVDTAPDAEDERREREKQELRLLYVGCTRARDRLVLATTKNDWQLKPLQPPPAPEASGPHRWGEREVEVVVRECAAFEAEVAQAPADDVVELPAAKTRVTAFVSPSMVEAVGQAVHAHVVGERVRVAETAEMNALGQALHGFLAADRSTRARAERVTLAEATLARWGQEGSVRAEAMVAASDALQAWAAKLAPGATWHRELPLEHAQADGSVLRGTADLVLESANGFWLIDHKSFPGGERQALERAAGHAGQLEAYAKAVSAALNKPCLSAFIHLPLLGRVVLTAND